MADNTSDVNSPKEASPYDALLAAAPEEKQASPYDALLTAAPEEKGSPYDALLAAAPDTSPASAAAASSTSPETGPLIPKSEELPYPEFTPGGMTQKLTPPSGLFASAGAAGTKAALEQISGIANEYEHLGVAIPPKAFLPVDQDRFQALREQLNDLVDQRERTQEGGGGLPDPREVEIANEMKMLGRPPSKDRLSGRLSEAAGQTFKYLGADPESKNFLAQLGRGIGIVGEMAPTMALGGYGLPAMAIQGASGAYAEAYDRSLKDGKTDTEAQQDASAAAVKTAPGLALYLVGGKLAGEAGAALMKEAGPAAKAIIGTAFATGANITVGSTLRALDGQDWRPTIESLTMDGLFGIMHGYGEWKGATAEVQQRAAQELVRRREDFLTANPAVSQKVFENIIGDMDEPTRLKTNALMARLNSDFKEPLPKELQDLHNDIQQKMSAGILDEMRASEAKKTVTGSIPEAAERALKTASSGREPSQPSKAIEPQVLDGLVRSRDALIRSGADPADIADVQQQLSAFDPAAISAAEERAKGPQPPILPPVGAEQPVAPGGPSGESATAESFKQAQVEKLKAASTLAGTAAAAAEVSPLAAAEAAKLAADVAAKANEPPPTTTENATDKISNESRGIEEHPGVSQGTDVQGDGQEVRKEDGQSPSDRGFAKSTEEIQPSKAELGSQTSENRKGNVDTLLSGLTNPSVKPVMEMLLKNTKVLQSVIRFIPIDVMHDLLGRKGSPEEHLNDVDMLLNRPPGHGNNDIFGRVSSALTEGVAGMRAETLRRLASGDVKGAAALLADFGGSRLAADLISFRPSGESSAGIPGSLPDALSGAVESGELPVGTDTKSISAELARFLDSNKGSGHEADGSDSTDVVNRSSAEQITPPFRRAVSSKSADLLKELEEEPVAESASPTTPDNEPAIEGSKEPASTASKTARDAAHERAYSLAQRIGEDVARGQPDIVKEAATIAAYKNAASSIDSRAEGNFNPAFMRKSAMRAAGEAAKKQPVSLDEPTGEDRTRLDSEAYDQLSPAEQVQRNDLHEKAQKSMEVLSKRERDIIRRVTIDGDSPADVAEDLGISRQAVEQINSKALEKLRKRVSEVETVGERKAAPPDKVEKLLGELSQKLSTKPGELLSDPLFIKSVGKPALKAAVDTMLAAYKLGKSVAESIADGIASLRGDGKEFDEDKAREYLDQYFEPEEAPKKEETTPETETPAGQAAPEQPESTAAPEKTSSSPEPATPAEPAQSRVVALRKSFTDAQREKMGLPAWDKPAALTNQEAWDEAQRVLAENPKAGQQLVDEMKKSPRALAPYEKAILLHEEGVRDTEYHAAIDAVNKSTTEQERLSAQLRLDAARDSNEAFYDAARASGRASGLSLQAHKMALGTETWSLIRMQDAIQARKPFGEKLTTKERAEIKNLYEQLDAERKRADNAEGELKNRAAGELLDKLAKEQKRQARAEASAVKAQGGTYTDWWNKREENAMERIKARRGKLLSTIDPLNLAGLADELIIGAAKVAKGLSKFPEWYASMKADLGDYFEPQAQAMFDESKKRANRDKKTFDEAPSKTPKASKVEKTPEGAKPEEKAPKGPKTKEEILNGIKEGATAPDQKTVYDLVKSKIEANPDIKLDKGAVSSIMQEVRDDLAPKFPDITEDQVRDAFTGHGKRTYPSKEQVNVKMRELRSAGDIISKIGEATRGEQVQKTGKQRDKPTQFQRDLTKELIRTMRENGVDTKALEGMMKTAHDARVTRIKNGIEDVQAQIAAGKRTPKTPGTPWTTEELALSQELGGLRNQLDALLDEPDSDQLNRIMNRIEAVTDKLDTGNIEPKAKSQNVSTKAVADATEKLGQLNEELAARRKALREAQNPPKTEEDRKIAALEKEEAKLTERIRTGKIDEAPRTPTADIQALGEAKNRVAALRRQIVEMREAKRDALNPPKTEEEKTLATLQKRQRAAEIALRDGKLETRTGRPSVDTEKVTKAKADLKEINQKLSEARKKSADGIQRELDRYKKMIDVKRADLQQRIATGDVSKPDRNPLSPEKTAIAKPYKLLQDKWERMKRQQELKSQTLPQKILRWTTYLGHEMLLLSPAVGVKLSSAAATTAGLIRPLEEVAGYAYGKALPFLAEKADVEIARSAGSLVRHESKAAAEAFMNVINDIGSTLKHGKSDFELEFGKEYSNEMVSYVGRFHGAFKTIPARQAFTATFLRLAEKYQARGLDITDPDVRFSIGTQALFKAIESKFQDPNLAVGAFKDAVRYIERKSPAAGAVTKAIAHTEMPVMTVASNITWRALENVYGLPVGSARLAMYFKNLVNNSFGKKGGAWVEKAMSDMSTEQADSIAKQLKRGTVGAAAFLIGAYLYQNLGGIHEKGDKQKPGDVKPEEVRPTETVRGAIRAIPLVGRPSGDIPKEFVHHPTFIDMQAGATMMRVAEEMKNRERQGIGRGLMAAGIATAAESPFGSAIQEGGKWIDPATRLDAEGNFARTFLGLTGPLAWLAKKQDTDASTGEPTRRKATTIGQELKLAVPGLRKEVPQARARGSGGSSIYR